MRIFLAAIEQSECTYFAQKGMIENAFYSYYYMRNNEQKTQRLVDNKGKHDMAVIDSGAHSFFSERYDEGLSASVKRKTTKTKATPDEYMSQYVEWIKKHWDCFDYYVELDIGEIVGQEKVQEWREELKKLNLFSKCITVMHPDVMSWKEYVRTLKESESKFLGIEGDRNHRGRLDYNKYIKEAMAHGVRVHGFAMTKNDVYGKYPFYSVDSTSWKAGVIYGAIMIFKDGKIKNVTAKNGDHVAAHTDIMNCNEIHDEDKPTQSRNRLAISVKAYKQAQDYYTDLWTKRKVIWT